MDNAVFPLMPTKITPTKIISTNETSVRVVATSAAQNASDQSGPYIRWVLRRLHALDDAYAGYTAGSVSKDLWEQKSAVLNMLFSDNVITAWRDVSQRYSTGFIAEVERLLSRRY